jgi:sugar lactone lactonase YvrE
MSALPCSLPRRIVTAAATAGAVAGLAVLPAAQARAAGLPARYIGQFGKINTIGSTVPANGDVNPYGVALIKKTHGRELGGDILVSNFNDRRSRQGTGTTLVELSPHGRQSLFARISGRLPGRCPGGVGVTTALAVLHSGWVVVGSTPSRTGLARTSGAGCLIFLNSDGQVKETISGHGIAGPWDLAAVDVGTDQDLFVTNVLNGTAAARGKTVYGGTVLRLRLSVHGHKPPELLGVTKVASGFAEKSSPATFVLGPTGVGLNSAGTMYVASTAANKIVAIPRAIHRTGSGGTGRVVTQGAGSRLDAPLGLAMAPNGDILTVNGNNGFVVETTEHGGFKTQVALAKAGALFGLALAPHGTGVYFVNDATNTLRLLH